MESKTHMQSEVFKLVPQWIKEAKEGQYSIMVGDDIDSLSTATLLNQVFGWKVNWFYDFRNVYAIDISNKTPRVGVDMALEKNQKTIDNHVTLLSEGDKKNNNSVNMNVMYGINRSNYTEKYAMSTLLTTWSLLGIPLPSTDEGKKILMSIDSSFKGHYNSKFKSTHNEWLRKLGFEELIQFLDDKTCFEELDIDIRNRYGLSEKINMNKNGQLQTNINLQGICKYLELNSLKLPIGDFNLIYELKRKNSKLGKKTYGKLDKTFSFALTYQNVASYTLL